MSDRDFTSAMLTELAEPVLLPAYLCELAFDSGTLYMTDADQDIAWNSNTYLRTGGLLSFSGLQETGELLINQITASLSGVDTSAAMAKVLADDFLDRDMIIRLALRDSNFDVIADPIIIFQGRMDGPSIAEDPDSGTSTVTVRGTPAFADFGRKPGRHTNYEEQQFYFPSDEGMEFVSEIPKVISWGRN